LIHFDLVSWLQLVGSLLTVAAGMFSVFKPETFEKSTRRITKPGATMIVLIVIGLLVNFSSTAVKAREHEKSQKLSMSRATKDSMKVVQDSLRIDQLVSLLEAQKDSLGSARDSLAAMISTGTLSTKNVQKVVSRLQGQNDILGQQLTDAKNVAYVGNAAHMNKIAAECTSIRRQLADLTDSLLIATQDLAVSVDRSRGEVNRFHEHWKTSNAHIEATYDSLRSEIRKFYDLRSNAVTSVDSLVNR
jgi:hypothetical protein